MTTGGLYTTQNSNTPSIQSTATAIASNPARIGWTIQNLGTNPLYVCLGTGGSTSVFHFVLKGGTGNDDGLGGSLTFTSGAVYTGIVTVAGSGLRYTTLEVAP